MCAQVTDPDALRHARVHPMSILMALKTYESGQGVRGKNTWNPVGRVVDALDTAFYLAFANVEPTGKHILLAIDASGSMDYSISGIPNLSCREAALAMALVLAKTEQNYTILAYTHGSNVRTLPITPRQRLDDAMRALHRYIRAEGTDCALPLLWAIRSKAKVDAFVILTDNETWAGRMHPVQALQEYRRKMGIPAKLVVVGMVSNGFSIADPNDSGTLDVVGFDASVPQVISDFIRS